MQRLPSLTVHTFADFDAAMRRLTSDKGGLQNGEVVRIDLAGEFRIDPLTPDSDVYWELVEEAQMRARLEGLPGGYWATLRGSGCADTLYFDILRLEA